MTFFILTLFACPFPLETCSDANLIPARYERVDQYKTEQGNHQACHEVGQMLVEVGEAVEYSCNRHME